MSLKKEESAKLPIVQLWVALEMFTKKEDKEPSSVLK